MDKNRASSLSYPGPSFDFKEVLAQATAREKNHARPKGVKQIMYNLKMTINFNVPENPLRKIMVRPLFYDN